MSNIEQKEAFEIVPKTRWCGAWWRAAAMYLQSQTTRHRACHNSYQIYYLLVLEYVLGYHGKVQRVRTFRVPEYTNTMPPSLLTSYVPVRGSLHQHTQPHHTHRYLPARIHQLKVPHNYYHGTFDTYSFKVQCSMPGARSGESAPLTFPARP